MEEKNVQLLGFISNDEEISSINLIGGNLLELPKDNPSYQEAKEIFMKIV